jgi:hypothetical protein
MNLRQAAPKSDVDTRFGVGHEPTLLHRLRYRIYRWTDLQGQCVHDVKVCMLQRQYPLGVSVLQPPSWQKQLLFKAKLSTKNII